MCLCVCVMKTVTAFAAAVMNFWMIRNSNVDLCLKEVEPQKREKGNGVVPLCLCDENGDSFCSNCQEILDHQKLK